MRTQDEIDRELDRLNAIAGDRIPIYKNPAWSLPQNLILAAGTQIDDFESLTGWAAVTSSPAGGSMALDNTHFKTGAGSLELTTPASAGYVFTSKTVSWTLNGNLQFWVYSWDSYPAHILLYMSNDSGVTNYFQASVVAGTAPGWSMIVVRPGDWTTGGSPSWGSTIVKVRIRVSTPDTTHSFSFDDFRIGVVRQGAVLFQFDDDVVSTYTEAYPYMSARNVRGTMFTIGSRPGSNPAVYMSWNNVRAIYRAGWVIGNHTQNHLHLDALSEADQETEINTCDATFVTQGITLRRKHLAFPFGNWNSDTLTACTNTGMLSARAVQHTIITWLPIDNWYHLPATFEPVGTDTLATGQTWLDTANSLGEIVIVLCHQIVNYYDPAYCSTGLFRGLVDYAVQIGLPCLTIDDLKNLESGPISI